MTTDRSTTAAIIAAASHLAFDGISPRSITCSTVTAGALEWLSLYAEISEAEIARYDWRRKEFKGQTWTVAIVNVQGFALELTTKHRPINGPVLPPYESTL